MQNSSCAERISAAVVRGKRIGVYPVGLDSTRHEIQPRRNGGTETNGESISHSPRRGSESQKVSNYTVGDTQWPRGFVLGPAAGRPRGHLRASPFLRYSVVEFVCGTGTLFA